MKLLFVLSILILFSCDYAFPDDTSFISVEEFIKLYEFSKLVKSDTGVYQLSKNNLEIKFLVGANTYIINNTLVRLQDAPKVVNGIIFLPRELVEQLSKERYEFHEVQYEVKDAQDRNFEKSLQHGIKIVIDPGHGGKYEGTKGLYGLVEKDITLDISKKLKDLLIGYGFVVFLTRTADIELSQNSRDDLFLRSEKTKEIDADIFISIHCNWEKTGNVEGYEIFIPCDEGRYDREERFIESELFDDKTPLFSGEYKETVVQILKNFTYSEYQRMAKSLAQEIRNEFRKELSASDRGVKEAGFYVIKWSRCPAALVETDFVSSHRGASRLMSESYRQKLADLIARAIVNFVKKNNF